MSSNIFRVTMFIAGMALLTAFFGVSTAQAAQPSAAICDTQSGNAFGLCRAAVSSGCAIGGRNTDSRHCGKLAANFLRVTEQTAIWLEPVSTPTRRRGDLGDS
ncbi:MAG: hypothetical protein KAU29_03695 [Gammaproteobacteria bacterium]|nr:hypothetical protein [Gammaproteobacteria bacterium]